MEPDSAQSIGKFIVWLRLLIAVSVTVTIIEAVYVFFSDYPISLYIDETLWTKELSSFSAWDRFVVMDLVLASAVFWFLALYEFWKLCDLYGQKKFFAFENARHLVRVGLFLMAIFVVDGITVPVVGAYLKFRDIIPQMPDMNVFMLDTDLIVAAVFFWLIAKVMERAALMKEEADLTV